MRCAVSVGLDAFPTGKGSIHSENLQVFDGSDGSDEESVVFKEYALGQLQKWIQRTVERSPGKKAQRPTWPWESLAFSKAEGLSPKVLQF